MTKQKKILASVFSAFVFFVVLMGGAFLLRAEDGAAHSKNEHSFSLLAAEKTTVDIVTVLDSEYALIYSSDSRQSDGELAKDFANAVREGSIVVLRPISDVAQKEQEFEILIGDTNREESAMLLETLQKYDTDGAFFIWGYTYINGKLAYTATSDIAFKLGMSDFLALVKSNGTVSVDANELFIGKKSVAEYEEELRKEEDEKMQAYIEELKKMNAEFDNLTELGKNYKPMIAEDGTGYFTKTKSGEPGLYPTTGQHPKYLITETNIPKIREMLAKGQSPDSEYYNLANNFWKFADATPEEHKYGVFPERQGSAGVSRYSANILAMIDAKALAYLITGEEVYALEAIVCIKNAMLTLKYTTDLHPDVYHGPSHTMVVLAAVYDWCYDYLTEEDKWQMIYGCALVLAPQMESGMNYPPSGMNAVSGHGTGPQLVRDWLSVSVAFYDEVPDWYRYVAGRFFNEYIPVHELQYEGGWVSQGTANYADGKLKYTGWAYYLLKCAVGENLAPSGMEQSLYFMMSHTTSRVTGNLYEQYAFQYGDGHKNPTGIIFPFVSSLYHAALFNNSNYLAQAKLFTKNYTSYNLNEMATAHPSFMACFISAVDYVGGGQRDGVGTIQYFAYPAASMTARLAWDDPNAPVVLMRILNLTAANHEGAEHGTFHIYYKGLISGTSGAYDSQNGNGYGSTSHRYYSQATVSANGLLIYNPSKSGMSSFEGEKYYYSGGQRQLSEAGTLATWTNGNYVMSETTGADWGYNKDGTPKFAYIAGDLTKAYDSSTVDYVSRSMFTLFTGNEDFPMLFFTFDRIASDKENFTKHWLLHTVKEPTVDADGMKATLTSGEGGKMYVESLFGADAIVKIGGAGKAWWINGDVSSNITSTDIGKNVPEGSKNDKSDIFWGRIELRAVGQKYSEMLTVMAVTDEENDSRFKVSKFVNAEGTIFGAKFDQDIVAFLNNPKDYDEYPSSQITFNTAGRGLYNYYIAGIESGTWQVLVDGISVAYSFSTLDGHMLNFIAPAGEVTIKPMSDVVGVNGGKITYEMSGGTMPSGTVYSYNGETGTALNAVPKRDNDVFVGWYTSPTFEPATAVNSVPKGTSGDYVVYAKWKSNFLNEDYETLTINNKGNQSHGGVSYNAQGKTGALFKTMVDENNKSYLEWTKGGSDPVMFQTSSSKNFTTLGSDELCVTYTVKLRLKKDASPMSSHFRLNVQYDVNGTKISNQSIVFFRTDSSGNVLTAGKSTLMTLSADKVSTLRVVVDFKNSELRYYGETSELLKTENFTVPAATGAKNSTELLKCLKNYLWYWYPDASAADAALNIYGIRVQDGDECK